MARYFVTDHLGSVRVVATDKNNVLERNDYYPFGKRWDTATQPVSDNRDRFNGKEDQVFIGDYLADYGARCYNKLNGRWLTQDPKAEDFINSSQYCFCGNNPINRIDANGAEWYSYQEEYEDEDGVIRTRTQYVFVEGAMSDEEMKKGNYTYWGRTYETNDTYFSLGGAQIKYNKSNSLELFGVQQIKNGDQAIISAVELWGSAGNFWQKYNNMIGAMGSGGVVLGEFMDLSKGFRGTVNAIGVLSTISNAFNDYHLYQTGNLHGVALSDAAANLVSVMGWQGATVSVGYTMVKAGARNMMKLEQSLQGKANELYKRYTGIYAGFGF